MKHGSWRDLRPIIVLFLTQQRRMLLLGVVLATATILSGVALLGLSGWFITATAIAGMSVVTALTFDVFAPSAGIRLLALVRTAARYGERLTTHDATLSILAITRERLFRGWARPGMARRLLMRPATLLFRLTVDVDALDSLYLRVIVPAVSAVVTVLVAGLAVWLAHAWTGFVFGVALLVAGFGITFVVAGISRRPARRRAFALEALRARTIDLSSGQTELALAGRLAAQHDLVLDADKRLGEADDALHRIETGAGAALGLVAAAILATMLLAAGLLVEGGLISAPVAALLTLIAMAVLEPFTALQRGALEAGRTMLSARRLAPQLVNTPEDTQTELANKISPPDPGVAVTLNSVVVLREGLGRPGLDSITLSVPLGQTIALVGASGAGKSTLLDLIAGELQLYSGIVRACPCTMLPQRTELFQDSVRDNLLLAAPLALENQLWQSLENAGLAATIREMPRGLDTFLGEGGLGLSGGQARRLALARMFLRPEPLWLVDEATEGLDPDTARDVLRRLYRVVREGKHALVIATHMRREAEEADRLIVMDQGRIIYDVLREHSGFKEILTAMRPD